MQKRFLSCLLALALLFSFVPAGAPARAEEAWSAVFERFVLNQEYLSSGLSFYSDAYVEPRFGLYDLDRDGTPELLAFNGGPSQAQGTDYVFVCENGSARYVGNVGFRGSAPYYYDSTAYPGLFCTDGNMGEYRTVYYELRGGAIVSELVMTSDEIASWSGQAVQATADDTLFALSRSGADAVRSLAFYSYDEIRAMGWQSFAGVVDGADSGWYAAYESFVLQNGYLNPEANSFLKISPDSSPEPRFSLYDLDRDGTPELIVEGGPYEQALQCSVFTCRDDKVVFRGQMGLKPCYYEGSAYPGLFYTQQVGNEYQVGYCWFESGTLMEEGVRNYTLTGTGAKDSRQVTTDRNLYNWSVGGQPTFLPFFALSEIRVMGWPRFVMELMWGSSAYTIGSAVSMSAEQQYAVNIFLSNFSEQHAFENGTAFDSATARYEMLDKLVNFAYLYCKINRHAALNTAQVENSYYYTLSLEEANAVWSRHFGFTLNEAEASAYAPYTTEYYRSFYSSGAFYFTAADGEAYNRFTVVRQMEDLGDGTYRLLFDIYSLDIDEYWKSNGVDSGFYALTASAARQDSRLTWENSGVAVVRPYSNNDNATYQLMRYRTGEKPAFSEIPVIDDEERQIEYGGYSTQFGPVELTKDSSDGLNNRNLAVLCAMLSDAAYTAGGTEIVKVYRQMFGEDGWDSEFDYDDHVFCSSAALGKMKINNEDTHVLVITFKGTAIDGRLDLSEVWADIGNGTSDYWGYRAFTSIVHFENKCLESLNSFLNKHPEIDYAPLKIIVTGHSLGGAAANLLAAHLTRLAVEEESWSAITSQKDIFCYTFGAIDSLSIYDAVSFANTVRYPISSGFENIHNVYNMVDTFGPYQMHVYRAKEFSGYGKFGHIDLFKRSYQDSIFDITANHMMTSYLHAVASGIVGEQKYSFSRVWVRCPVDVEVYENGVLLGSVHNDEVTLRSDEIDIHAYEGEKMVVFPSDKDLFFRFLATDGGTMEYAVETFSSDSVEVKLFENVTLTKGKIMSSELTANGSAEDARLYVLDSDGRPVGEIQTNGTEVAMQASGLFGLPAESARWLIVALAALLVALICLVILLVTRGKQPARKRSAAPPRAAAAGTLPAFSETRCCVCGRRLEGKYRVFFRTKDGREARLDSACYRQLYTLRKSEDAGEIREAQRYIRSRCDAVDPRIAAQLRKCVEAADEYLSEL